jgi:hypothetical protein
MPDSQWLRDGWQSPAACSSVVTADKSMTQLAFVPAQVFSRRSSNWTQYIFRFASHSSSWRKADPAQGSHQTLQTIGQRRIYELRHLTNCRSENNHNTCGRGFAVTDMTACHRFHAGQRTQPTCQSAKAQQPRSTTQLIKDQMSLPIRELACTSAAKGGATRRLA